MDENRNAVSDNPEQPAWHVARSGGVAALTCWHGPDGEAMLASAGTDGTVRVWDASMPTAAAGPFVGHTAAVWALTSWRTADGGARVASSGTDGTIRIWDPHAGTLVGDPVRAHRHRVEALVSWVTPGGAVRLASADASGAVRIWDGSTGLPADVPVAGHRSRVVAMACWVTASSAARLASADVDGRIEVWDADQGVALGALMTGDAGAVSALAGWALPDGTERLAAAGDDGRICLWDPRSGQRVGEPLIGHAAGVGALVSWFDADGRARLASAGRDGVVRLWDPEAGAEVGSSGDLHTGRVVALACWPGSPGAGWLASVDSHAVIQVWETETGRPVNSAAAAHAAGVWSLATWTLPDGSVRLASAGDDGTVRVWNPDSGTAVGAELPGHNGGVWALRGWFTADGEARLASGGHDGAVVVWKPDEASPVARSMKLGDSRPWSLTYYRVDGAEVLAFGLDDGTITCWEIDHGEAAVRTLRGHTARVGALVTWTAADGSARLASADHDGLIRCWDPALGVTLGDPWDCGGTRLRALDVVDTGGAVLLAAAGDDGLIHIFDLRTGSRREPIAAHDGPIRALVSWRAGTGEARLASAGYDGTVRIWDVTTGSPTGDPLRGHTAALQALTVWSSGDDTRLASAGYDGTIRLWDPERGVALRTIEVGPVALWALSDAPARTDLLDRATLAAAVADQLRRPHEGGRIHDPGPGVITVEGPWGCGKSTLMSLIRDRLSRTAPPQPSVGRTPAPMNVREALSRIRDHSEAESAPQLVAEPGGVVSAWFNPWTHQSGEQVWAGLADAILTAAAPVLYPSTVQRERYWFAHNLRRMDRFGIARLLRRRAMSPLLGLPVIVATLPVVVTLTGLGSKLRLFGHTLPPLAVGLAATIGFLLIGLAHTAVRHRYGRASRYLPGGLFHGPVVDDPSDGAGQPDAISDPLRRARAGSLYLYQHDIGRVLADLSSTNHDLVLFIDDLDRCGTRATAEVIEAVNLFLAGFVVDATMRARFVIGLDPDIVAAHLDEAHPALVGDRAVRHADDPSMGWAYLRKFVQLPVAVPRVGTTGVDTFLDRVVGGDDGERMPSVPADPARAATAPRASAADAAPRPATLPPNRPVDNREPTTPVVTVAWRSTERHPQVRSFLRDRLLAQPDRSIREFKRLLNVWQLYERIMATRQPLDRPEANIRRSCDLILLAEITTRWPALRSHLQQENGLPTLVMLADDDHAWDAAVGKLRISTQHERALEGLRSLLAVHGGRGLAEAAAVLL
ncbi:P-loop NTPase fold protein [Micromonospora sp. RP3T]|uniref:P-loop NTPase fold protein n=1 Tax=Micromonospora sp. RP3T TaxID=2135446 RepID=UPI003D70274F